MEFTTPPTDLDAVRRYRLGRVREALARRDYAGIILFDQLNIRYATDATNMQVWCSHNEARYVLVTADGPVILFDYGGRDTLCAGLPTIDETRPATSFFYMLYGHRHGERARLWAVELDQAIRAASGNNRRIAIDRVAPAGVQQMEGLGYQVFDGFELMETARSIKSAGEVALMQHAISVCEDAVASMRRSLAPGISENALWAELHRANIAGGGEWIETRLLSSGPRTNPWFRECSMRRIEHGDLVSFDTDLVGPYGYCCDMSRSWVCGEQPSDDQRRLYAEARLQVEDNIALLEPGLGFAELTRRLRPLPERYRRNRYGVAMHGVGLCDEYPSIYYPEDFATVGFDGVLEAGMVLCVEALIGDDGGREAVKLEEQVLITEDGCRRLTRYPMEDHWL